MSELSVSPLAPDLFPEMPAVAGVRLATFAAGLRYQNRADLMLAELSPGTTVGGVMTKSLCPSAPVDWCRRILPSGTARAVICNSGNANAFTGKAGETSAALTAETVGQVLGVDPDQVFLASTGVIGETLSDEALGDALPKLAERLDVSSPATWNEAAAAIRTTDTFSKGASAPIGESGCSVVGIAKGSGMIAPDMATMLAFVFTDAGGGAPALQAHTAAAAEASFNRITVDSDTSTSDTVLLLRNRGSPVQAVDASDFQQPLDSVMLDLAHQIVRDGEGATKFVEVTVRGAAQDQAAKTIALAIGNSPLVKTALAAEDANWGRVVMAVGKAGQEANRDALSIWIGDELVAEGGVQAESYSEERATEHLKQPEVRIVVDVGVGHR